jgi:membrane associated rhomboid family serine protease
MTVEPETAAAPGCYRHPDRPTYVRCTRCDRPICPDCMNEAAVGFQCPECVKQGRVATRTVFGGKATAAARATTVLIAMNVVVFVLQLAVKGVTGDYEFYAPALVHGGQYYRLITSAFLHSPDFIFHIGFNMYALFVFGTQVERLLGTARYLVLYLVAALGGSVATYLLMSPGVPSLGASGAVFGLFGAYFVMARKLRADTSQLVVLIGINLAIGFAGRGFINNYAHLGGLVTGGLVALVYTRVPRGRNQAALQFGGALGIALALAVVVVLRTNDLRQHPPLDQSLRAPARSAASAAATSAAGAPSR